MNSCRLVILASLLWICALPSGAVGQGFSGFNGRNHPELDWQKAETDHFEIIFPAHLQGVEYRVGAVAEASYTALSANLNVVFERKIRVYLSDEDEIANGFAMPVGNGHTNIWIHVNDVAEKWTGTDKWIRKVLAHELAHIFHYRSVRSRWRPFDRLVANSLPRFWTEGLAQYQTEEWDAFRGERWLRTAVLDDQLSYSDGRSRWNARLLYAVGNSQVRYFAQQYGDSTLADLLAVRKPVLFGLAKVHDFPHALKQTTGKSYSEFREDWRRHINIQYNSLAAHMESVDSLQGEPVTLSGKYVDDIRYDDATGSFVAVSLESVERPVVRLSRLDSTSGSETVLTEGSLGTQVAVSRAGTFYSRRTRGRAGSIINDVFGLDEESNQYSITTDRRAAYPDISPDGERLAFVVTNGQTTNVVVRNLTTGTEQSITDFTGDHQIARLRWSPDARSIALSSFNPEGIRQILVVDTASGSVRPITDGEHDDRGPVWSPDGSKMAFTSLRDGVPNVFVTDLHSESISRVTNVVTGTTVHDWTPRSDSSSTGHLVVISAESKRRDVVHLINPDRKPFVSEPPLRTDLWAWTSHRPPAEIPADINADNIRLTDRSEYSSLRNLTHTFSIASPYYTNGSDWGLFGVTAWMEPLGKHLLLFSGGYSVPAPATSSFVSLAYVNRQLTPTLQFGAFHFPTSARPYGNTILEERSSGGSITGYWPIDFTSPKPYSGTNLITRLRFMHVEPTNIDSLPMFEGLPLPESGSQTDLRVGVVRRKLKPFRHNVVHPLDGQGIRVRGTIGFRNSDLESPFVIGDAGAYSILKGPGQSRFLVYGRLQAQSGRSLAQNYMGLSRYDELRISSPGFFELTFSDVERVRGFREFSAANRLAFSTIEYRIPLAPSLETRLLGLVSFGKTTMSLFADGAYLFSGRDIDDAETRLGLGVEFKNALTLGGSFRLMHAIGVAQPSTNLFARDVEVYYRIRTPLPF